MQGEVRRVSVLQFPATSAESMVIIDEACNGSNYWVDSGYQFGQTDPATEYNAREAVLTSRNHHFEGNHGNKKRPALNS